MHLNPFLCLSFFFSFISFFAFFVLSLVKGGSTANSTSTRTGNGVMLNATNAKLGNIAGNCGVNVTTVSFELSQFDTAATDESGGGDEFGPVKGGLSSIGTSNCTNSIAVAATFGLDGTDAVHATRYSLAALSFKLSQRCCDRCPHPQKGGLVIYSGVANVSDSTDATKGLNMVAKINTSLQCNTSAFNYTLAASKEDAHPLKSVTITDVAGTCVRRLQLFVTRPKRIIIVLTEARWNCVRVCASLTFPLSGVGFPRAFGLTRRVAFFMTSQTSQCKLSSL